MVRKWLLATIVFGLFSVIFFGRDTLSYICTSASQLTESVRHRVPLEFELDRARKMVRNLVPEIRRNMHVIAQEEVEVDRLNRKIATQEKKVGRDRDDLQRLASNLSEERSTYDYAGRHFSAVQVKIDLARRFERFKTAEATLASLQDIHQARLTSLDAARKKLDVMLASKRQLQVDVENLAARLKMVEVAQTTSNYYFDNSQLSRVRNLIIGIRTRLDVAEKLVNTNGQLVDEIILEDPPPENIVQTVTEYFESPPIDLVDVRK